MASGLASHGRASPQPFRDRLRPGAATGGHRPLPGPHRGERRGRLEPRARPLVRVPLRRGRDPGGDGPVVLVVADVYVGHRVGGRREAGVILPGAATRLCLAREWHELFPSAPDRFCSSGTGCAGASGRGGLVEFEDSHDEKREVTRKS